MKRLLLGIFTAVAAVSPAVMSADDAPRNIWKYNKGINIGFITHQGLKDMDSEIPFQYDSSFGISFSTGASYLWPRSEGWAGNRVKVGVDARWFEISYVKYKKYPKIDGVQLDGWNSDIEDDWEDEDIIDNMNTQQLHMGVGLGPTVACVPFPNADSALKFLRVNLTAHFNPSASALLYKDEYGDTNVSWAFVPAFDFGMSFQWKNFVLGFEGKWGRAKYKSLFEEDEFENSFDSDGISMSSGQKQTFKNSSFRINLGFRF
ncbi:MAG: hypothetical protein K2J70_02895 [Muribaculaceae bacterium]|nr:hypothetical protein [Muribaculaceae bacterium]